MQLSYGSTWGLSCESWLIMSNPVDMIQKILKIDI